MKLKLDAHSRDQLSSLRHQWTEQSNKENKDVEEIKKLDQELLESSLGHKTLLMKYIVSLVWQLNCCWMDILRALGWRCFQHPREMGERCTNGATQEGWREEQTVGTDRVGRSEYREVNTPQHHNVAGVSAHERTLTERQILLDQLNEMTEIAAEMEKQPSMKSFTDVLNYDIKENNWNIPGLWHGTPPMASVNTGYSEAVADFKNNLLETVKKDKTDDVSQIPEFLKWIESLWKAVKYENFIFSFRNTLVAHAYDNLCKEFNQWEWEFKKDLLSWQEAARRCVKPAVEEYISRHLGTNIVDKVLAGRHSAEYSSRNFFQYNSQKELLQKEDFQSFVKFICNYEIYVKDLIFQDILQEMSENKTWFELKKKNLKVIVNKIKDATEKASKGRDGVLLPDNKESITELIKNMRTFLTKDILISEEAEKSTLFQIQSTCHPFKESLVKSLSEMDEQLQEEFSKSKDIAETVNKLPTKPQDELFDRVFGCGQQCPFCKVPCEAGGKDHEHVASVHRPQGLGRYRYEDTQKLVVTMCTTNVHSELPFNCADTNGKWHPFKEYRTIYPDWLIPPDYTREASDYWKYVLVKFNERFAQEFNAKPADVPEAWRKITKDQALKGLKDAFNIKD
ncbi:hypothetical protein F7725_025940 [Dissostichus mawsoni]|uniref:VLIG-type G domain-containing protein n=1 Tax=Dissostichus mawsoni TaxID=36200 RepID=A0A7J5X5P7_DISMA|nr:hypothetical protein F7725_025940 [Dissostichus mawsoni]